MATLDFIGAVVTLGGLVFTAIGVFAALHRRSARGLVFIFIVGPLLAAVGLVIAFQL